MTNAPYRWCICTLGESCGMSFFSVQIILCFLFEPLVCGHCHLKEIFNDNWFVHSQCGYYDISLFSLSPLWISLSCSKNFLSKRLAFSLSCEVSIARFLLQRKLDSLCALSVRLLTSGPKNQIKDIRAITHTTIAICDWYVHFSTQTDLNDQNTDIDWWITVHLPCKTDCAAICSCSGRCTVLRFVTPGWFRWGAPFKKSACSRGAAELWHFK